MVGDLQIFLLGIWALECMVIDNSKYTSPLHKPEMHKRKYIKNKKSLVGWSATVTSGIEIGIATNIADY